MPEYFVLYLLLGIFAGIIAGLLGVGGGLIIVPVLALVFARLDYPPGMLMQLAVGTSLATIVFTSIASVRAHHRHGAVLWPVFLRLTPGIVVGALLGAVIADQLRSDVLRVGFALFELTVAAQMLLSFRPRASRNLPGAGGLLFAGSGIGTFSSILGIGGGTLTVPYLLWNNIGIRQAVATSSACGLPIAVAGSVGFIWAGWGGTENPDHSLGYVYWPAALGIVLTSMLFAPVGAYLAHHLPVQVLRRVFALFLAILGLRMLWSLH